MPRDFDPYHVWLGIPPEERPYNYYRLLGLSCFEGDAEVIQNAADRQMAFVNTFKIGKHADATQYLLTELSAAAGCLLNPILKVDYDAQLRSYFFPTVAMWVPVSSSQLPPPLVEVCSAFPPPLSAIANSGAADGTTVRRRSSKRRRPDTNAHWEIVKIAVGGIVGIVLAVLFLFYFAKIDLLGISKTQPRKSVANAKVKVRTARDVLVNSAL